MRTCFWSVSVCLRRSMRDPSESDCVRTVPLVPESLHQSTSSPGNHTRDDSKGGPPPCNRFRNFFPIPPHFETVRRSVETFNWPAAGANLAGAGRSRRRKQQQQQQTPYDDQSIKKGPRIFRLRAAAPSSSTDSSSSSFCCFFFPRGSIWASSSALAPFFALTNHLTVFPPRRNEDLPPGPLGHPRICTGTSSERSHFLPLTTHGTTTMSSRNLPLHAHTRTGSSVTTNGQSGTCSGGTHCNSILS